MPLSPELKQAFDAAKAGDKATARRILKQVLREDQNNETAWFLYAQVTDRPEHAVSSLKKVLEINPYNERAKKMLADLTPKEAPKPEPNAPWDYDRYIEKQEQSQGGPKKVKKSNKTVQLVIAGILAIFLLCAGGGFFAASKMLAPTPTPFPTKVRGTPTITPETCSCQPAQEYMQRSLDRFNGMLGDMETLTNLLNASSFEAGEIATLDTIALARLKEQRAETPPPCLDGFNKETVQLFWSWQQALGPLQSDATLANINAVIAFIDNLVEQSNQMDDQVEKVMKIIPGCTLPELATPEP